MFFDVCKIVRKFYDAFMQTIQRIIVMRRIDGEF